MSSASPGCSIGSSLSHVDRSKFSRVVPATLLHAEDVPTFFSKGFVTSPSSRRSKSSSTRRTMPPDNDTPMRVRWARLRFQILGPLLAALPVGDDSLWPRIEEAAAKTYRHPSTGAPVRY